MYYKITSLAYIFRSILRLVDLWTKEKGFQLTLLHDWIEFKNEEPCYCLAPGLTNYIEDDYTEKYGDFFMPLEYYKRTNE